MTDVQVIWTKANPNIAEKKPCINDPLSVSNSAIFGLVSFFYLRLDRLIGKLKPHQRCYSVSQCVGETSKGSEVSDVSNSSRNCPGTSDRSGEVDHVRPRYMLL